MTYENLVYWHLGTVVPAFLIGTYLLVNRKGTSRHKLLGKLYMMLMMITAAITLFMPADIGPILFAPFGFIHLLSVLVLYTVPTAFFAARAGNVKRHKYNMMGLYVGGILIAGTFAMMPGRLLHEWLFSYI